MGVIVSIRVICGFLAGLAAGILIMRVMYRSKGMIPVSTKESMESSAPAKIS